MIYKKLILTNKKINLYNKLQIELIKKYNNDFKKYTF